MARMRWVVCVFALLWPTSAWSASEVPASIPRLRPLGGRAAEMLERGTAQSPTFWDLVARLGQSDVVVYVEIAPRRPGSPAGATRFVTVSTDLRFLHVTLDRELPPRALVALLGHELQHALEVAEAPGIRDVATFRQYYEGFGLHACDGRRFDSNAAREAGRRVRQELGAPPGSGEAL